MAQISTFTAQISTFIAQIRHPPRPASVRFTELFIKTETKSQICRRFHCVFIASPARLKRTIIGRPNNWAQLRSDSSSSLHRVHLTASYPGQAGTYLGVSQVTWWWVTRDRSIYIITSFSKYFIGGTAEYMGSSKGLTHPFRSSNAQQH